MNDCLYPFNEADIVGASSERLSQILEGKHPIKYIRETAEGLFGKRCGSSVPLEEIKAMIISEALTGKDPNKKAIAQKALSVIQRELLGAPSRRNGGADGPVVAVCPPFRFTR